MIHLSLPAAILCHESRLITGVPLVHLMRRCCRRALFLPTASLLTGSRGTGPRCQLNRGINSHVSCYTVDEISPAHQSGYMISHHSPYEAGKFPGNSCSCHTLIFPCTSSSYGHLPYLHMQRLQGNSLSAAPVKPVISV